MDHFFPNFTKIWLYYNFQISKRYKFSKNLKGVPQKLSLVCPFQFWTSNKHSWLNFLVSQSKFWSMIDYFIGHQMIFLLFFCICYRIAEVLEKPLFLFESGTQVGIIVHNHGFSTSWGLLKKWKSRFSQILTFLMERHKKLIKI